MTQLLFREDAYRREATATVVGAYRRRGGCSGCLIVLPDGRGAAGR